MDGTLATVVDTLTTIPNGIGEFTSFFTFPAFDDGHVAFLAEGSAGQQGIFTNVHGQVEKVVDLNDTIDGRAISNLALSWEGPGQRARCLPSFVH